MKPTTPVTNPPSRRVLTTVQKTKIVGITVLAIVINLVFWLLYREILAVVADNAFSSASIIPSILTFVAFLALLAFVAITGILVEERLIARGILMLCAVTYLAAFGISLYSTVSVLLLLLAFWQYEWSIKGETADRVKFSAGKSAQAGIGLTITLVLLAIAVTFNGNLSKVNEGTSALDAFLNFTGDTANQLLAAEVPNYDPHEPLDTFLLRLVADQSKQAVQQQTSKRGLSAFSSFGVLQPTSIVESLGGVSINDLLKSLPADVRSRIGTSPEALRQYTTQQADTVFYNMFSAMRNQLIVKLGITADGKTPIGEVVRDVVKKNLQPRVGSYARFVPSLFAVTIFVTLQIFSFLYTWLVVLLVGILFWFLRKIQLIEIQTTQVEKQHPVITA